MKNALTINFALTMKKEGTQQADERKSCMFMIVIPASSNSEGSARLKVARYRTSAVFMSRQSEDRSSAHSIT